RWSTTAREICSTPRSARRRPRGRRNGRTTEFRPARPRAKAGSFLLVALSAHASARQARFFLELGAELVGEGSARIDVEAPALGIIRLRRAHRRTRHHPSRDRLVRLVLASALVSEALLRGRPLPQPRLFRARREEQERRSENAFRWHRHDQDYKL